MSVFGIGNVTGCNRSYIFLNDDGKQSSIASNRERLQDIRTQAAADEAFYDRFYKEVRAEYERQYEAVKAKYHYITDDDIAAVLAAEGNSKRWFDLTYKKQSNNEECHRQFNLVFGFADAANYAWDMSHKTHKLRMQAENALKEMEAI